MSIVLKSNSLTKAKHAEEQVKNKSHENIKSFIYTCFKILVNQQLSIVIYTCSFNIFYIVMTAKYFHKNMYSLSLWVTRTHGTRNKLVYTVRVSEKEDVAIYRLRLVSRPLYGSHLKKMADRMAVCKIEDLVESLYSCNGILYLYNPWRHHPLLLITE